MSTLTISIDRRGSTRHAQVSPASGLFSPLRRALDQIHRAFARSAQRRQLRDLVDDGDEHLLRDIGLAREQARREAGKWPWQR